MKIPTPLFAAVALSALLAGAAGAQTVSSGSQTYAPAPGDVTAPAPSVSSPSLDVTASSGALGSTGETVKLDSSTLGDPATAKAGDPGVVSNGPIPDTPENRARYGQPISRGGKATAPRGN